MAKSEWLTAGEIIVKINDLGITHDGEPYADPQVVRRWHYRWADDLPSPRRIGTTSVALYNWTALRAWLEDRLANGVVRP